ncbi:MAG TPA: beta-galactosidase, partial [Leptospiraceae bacterium]|nr:beta-galactosidase [Leptospiraceae bacterium]
MNEAWQTAFWSQGYSDFSEVPLPLRSYADPNPGLELDFRRAMNDAWRTFQAEQIELIRIHSPGRKITHNFMTLFFELDPWAISADLDTAGFDHYQMETEPHPVSSAWQFRLMASLKKRSFLVLEQQPVQVNWQKVNRRFSLHWLFLWGMQALFCGADSMLYFSWQRMYGGAEQYHDGIVPHDIRVEFSEQEELLAFQNRFLSALKAAGIEQMQAVCDVSIVLDFESVWSHEIAAQSEIFTTRRIADLVSDVCLSSGLGFSFARTIEQADPSARMLVLPSHAFELTNSEREFLASFVEKGGILLTLPRSLMKRRDNRMSELPLSVFSAADLKMLSYGALLESESETFVTNDGRKFHGLLWAERIRPGAGIEIIARFEGGLYAGAPA